VASLPWRIVAALFAAIFICAELKIAGQAKQDEEERTVWGRSAALAFTLGCFYARSLRGGVGCAT
jgi:hypothetical protein